MRGNIAALGAVVLLATVGCQTTEANFEKPPTLKSLRPYQVGSATIESGCNVTTSTIWQDTARGRYRLEARVIGDTCDHEETEVSLAIRAPSKRVIMRLNFLAKDIKDFVGVEKPKKMRSRLIGWMTNYGRSGQTSEALPSWDDSPKSRFVIDPAVTREAYEAARTAARPMLCFVDSLTTKRCVVLSEDESRLDIVGHIDLTR